MSSTSRRGEVRIGTSGWHYKHWVGTFYPPKTPASKMLAYYYQHFDTVELNNTFYRLPPVSGLEVWRDSTPDNFVLAAKGSRFLTHMKKLKDPEPGLARFFERIDVLGEKLGPILFQLPPHWQVDRERFQTFVAALPSGYRYAFEFRNATWDNEEIYRILRDRNIGYCIFDLAGAHSPSLVTASFAYVRLHGPGGKYQGSYSDSVLSGWAERILKWRAELDAIYLYFDNDEAGYAAKDALRLKSLVAGH
jgi:uncharacterized protein YecE (DUF72 family)